jgi:hypothetical protein
MLKKLFLTRSKYDFLIIYPIAWFIIASVTLPFFRYLFPWTPRELDDPLKFLAIMISTIALGISIYGITKKVS